MRSGKLAWAVAAALVGAGCISSEPAAQDLALEVEGKTATQLAEDAAQRNTTVAPVWQPGEWWRLRLHEQFSGQTFETTRVVAGVEGDYYLVGMPPEEFSDEFMVLHIPGFGQIDRADLAYETHDVPFIPAPFPLTKGKQWSTAFEGSPLNGVVVGSTERSAHMRLEGSQFNIDAIYDAATGALSRLEIEGYGVAEVLDHGFGYEGLVRVPHEHDLVFMNGRIAGGIGIPGLTPAPPTETIEVSSSYQRVSFAMMLGDLQNIEHPGLGYYSVEVKTPDGTTYREELLPAESSNLKVSLAGHDNPGGTWEATYVAAGPGLSAIEGIGYHVFDIVLPDGCLIAAEGTHAHGDPSCGMSGHQHD